MDNKSTVAVAMSGGVDSTTSAILLKQSGLSVIGITMRLYTGFSTCCGLQDVEDARKACEYAGIPFHVISFEKEFSRKVIDTFVDEYIQGRTPNPCILCNQFLKFDLLMERARAMGAESLATGHYARIQKDSVTGQYQLLKAVDSAKDQSYFLFSLTQDILSRLVFPLGDYTKEQTRQMAKKYGVQIHDKDESQDICFVTNGDYSGFVESWINLRNDTSAVKIPGAGEFVDTAGNVLGQHKGIHRYTIGQRTGLGIAVGRPVYVNKIDAENNRVVLGDKDELLSSGCEVDSMNWISGIIPDQSIQAEVKIRYRHPGESATIRILSETKVEIRFDSPQRAITPGQAAVIYNGDQVLGGGWISRTIE